MSEEQQHHLALPQGTRIRDFEFHRVLGHGGFGITYLGWNIALDIPVAIKEYLPTGLATRKSDQSVVPQSSQVVSDFQWGLERFLDEARTLARLQHLNIVRVHQYFEAHGTAYIAMDYVEGEDLSAYLTRKGTLSEDELKAILYPLLDALEVVHGADFLHRDIKPGNIVLRDVDGSPVLLDFGAARQAIGAKSRSVTSIVTPGYAPIEQYSSRGRQGAWTDIYALGGVCYRALTGQVPDDATDRMRNDPLTPVAERCRGQASRRFLLAIDSALSVDEGDRPQSVAAWRVALEVDAAEAQKDEVGDATIVKRMEQDAPPSEPQKKPPFKRLAVVLGVVVLLVVGGKMYADHAEQAALEKQRQEQATLEKQRQEQATLEKQRQEQAALEKQRQEQAALEKQRQEQAALEKQRREQAALEKQRQEEQAILELSEKQQADSRSLQEESLSCGPFFSCKELRKHYPDGVSRDHCAYREALDGDGDGRACEPFCGPFFSCKELRKHYPDGVSRDHCAYREALDGDGDGRACEPFCGPFFSCKELRKHYPDGVSKDHCAYREALDGDGDGRACEPYRR